MDERLTELLERVKKGSVSAAFDLAEAFKWGYYGLRDPRRAARMYRICCRSKDKELASRGYLNLGLLYYYGYLSPEEENGSEDARHAFGCFMKSALTFPNKAALTRLGDMYRYGQYVEKDEGVALRLYLKANA
jgi:TPR repeat protein